jgi:hypothetical protein
MIGTDVTTVPGAGPSVIGPTSRTRPQNSWPMKTSRERSGGVRPTSGTPSMRAPTSIICGANLAKCRSDPQIPQAATSMSTSPWPGAGSSTSSRTNTAPLRNTADRIPTSLPTGPPAA